MTKPPPIMSDRLTLVSMSPAFLEACLSGERTAAAREIGLDLPSDWFAQEWLMRMRLDDLRKDPSWEPWLLRAIRLNEGHEMIGHIGFHTAPDPEYLRELAPGGVEMGYTIFPTYRRQGYAIEAVEAMINWAAREHGQRRFVLSISPENIPSLRIAQHFGFVKVGSQIDEQDGVEDVYQLDIDS